MSFPLFQHSIVVGCFFYSVFICCRVSYVVHAIVSYTQAALKVLYLNRRRLLLSALTETVLWNGQSSPGIVKHESARPRVSLQARLRIHLHLTFLCLSQMLASLKLFVLCTLLFIVKSFIQSFSFFFPISTLLSFTILPNTVSNSY